MDQAITAVIGAVIFIAFAFGLAQSIGSLPFYVIVVLVIGAMAYDTLQVIRGALPKRDSKNSK